MLNGIRLKLLRLILKSVSPNKHTPEPLQERPKGLPTKLWHQVFLINVKPIRNAKTRDVTLQQGGYLCPKCDGFSLCFEATGMVD